MNDDERLRATVACYTPHLGVSTSLEEILLNSRYCLTTCLDACLLEQYCIRLFPYSTMSACIQMGVTAVVTSDSTSGTL